MTKRMLIDASHAEETRVVVMDDNRIEDFDYENSLKKQLKGNIYLARVTRVEPSLQAAFVEYGGNRHGFLAFNEIHPDYYRIPVEDREALIAEEAAAGDLEDDDAPLEEAEEEPPVVCPPLRPPFPVVVPCAPAGPRPLLPLLLLAPPVPLPLPCLASSQASRRRRPSS